MQNDAQFWPKTVPLDKKKSAKICAKNIALA